MAKELGFLDVGFSRATQLDQEAKSLEDWLNKGRHGKMSYMERNFDLRTDPTILVPGAKSVISLSFNYYTDQPQLDPEAPRISKYARGEDYHFIVKDKLYELFKMMKKQIGVLEGRVFVDSAPVLEKAWAARSGLGWIGKHTNLISKRTGSFFFLAEIISDLEIEEDGPTSDHCGTCTKCIDACPTDALSPYNIDATKCISYLTIELRDAIPTEFKGKMENWTFGCDICQDVCPWNRFSKNHKEENLGPSKELLDLSSGDWHEMTEETFRRVFKKSAVKRTKYSGLMRNLEFIKEI